MLTYIRKFRFSRRSSIIRQKSRVKSFNLVRKKRFLKVHEHQGIELMRNFNLPVVNGFVAQSPEEAYDLAKKKI